MNAMQSKSLHWFSAAAAVAILAGCSSGGAPTVVNPVTTAPAGRRLHRSRLGQRRRAGVPHQPLGEHQGNNRCGQCHNAGGQTPQFARNDDVNLAYQAANTVVNLTQPDQSRMVTEGGGRPQLLAAVTLGLRRHADGLDPQLGRRQRHRRHADPAAGADHQGSGRQQELPGDVGGLRCLFSVCAGAQRRHGELRALPLLERGHAAAAVLRRMRTSDVGLRGHQVEDQSRQPRGSRASSCACATSSTTAGARGLRGQRADTCWTAIDGVRRRRSRSPASIRSLLISKGLTLYDGTVARGGNRYEAATIAMYEFKTGMGTIAYDTSGRRAGAEPHAVGRRRPGSAAGASTSRWAARRRAPRPARKKLTDLIKATGEFTIEAWATTPTSRRKTRTS